MDSMGMRCAFSVAAAVIASTTTLAYPTGFNGQSGSCADTPADYSKHSTSLGDDGKFYLFLAEDSACTLRTTNWNASEVQYTLCIRRNSGETDVFNGLFAFGHTGYSVTPSSITEAGDLSAESGAVGLQDSDCNGITHSSSGSYSEATGIWDVPDAGTGDIEFIAYMVTGGGFRTLSTTVVEGSSGGAGVGIREIDVRGDNSVLVRFYGDVRAVGGGQLDDSSFAVSLAGGVATLTSYSVATTTLDSEFRIVLVLDGEPDGSETVSIDVVEDKIEDITTGTRVPPGFPFQSNLIPATDIDFRAAGRGNAFIVEFSGPVYYKADESLALGPSDFVFAVSGGTANLTGLQIDVSDDFAVYTIRPQFNPAPDGTETATINIAAGKCVNYFSVELIPPYQGFQSELNGTATYTAALQPDDTILVLFTDIVGTAASNGEDFLVKASFSVGPVPGYRGSPLLGFTVDVAAGVVPSGSAYSIRPNLNGLATGDEVLEVDVASQVVMDYNGNIVPPPESPTTVALRKQTGFRCEANATDIVRVTFQSPVKKAGSGDDLDATSFRVVMNGGRSIYLQTFTVTRSPAPFDDGSNWDLQLRLEGPTNGFEAVTVSLIQGNVEDQSGAIVLNPDPLPVARLLAATTFSASINAANTAITVSFTRDVTQAGALPDISQFNVTLLNGPNLTMALSSTRPGSLSNEVVIPIVLEGVQLGDESVRVQLAETQSLVDSQGEDVYDPESPVTLGLSATPYIMGAYFVDPPRGTEVAADIPVDKNDVARVRIDYSEALAPADGEAFDAKLAFEVRWIPNEGLAPADERPAMLTSWLANPPASQAGIALQFELQLEGLLLGVEQVEVSVKRDAGGNDQRLQSTDGLRLPSQLQPIVVYLPQDPRSNVSLAAFEFPLKQVKDIAQDLRIRWQVETETGRIVDAEYVEENGDADLFVRMQLERLADEGILQPAGYIAVAPSRDGRMVGAETGLAVVGDLNGGVVSAWELELSGNGQPGVSRAATPAAMDENVRYSGPPRLTSNASLAGADRVFHFRRRLTKKVDEDIDVDLTPGVQTDFIYAMGLMTTQGQPAQHFDSGTFSITLMRPADCRADTVCSDRGVCIQDVVPGADPLSCSCNVGYDGDGCRECAPGFLSRSIINGVNTCEFPSANGTSGDVSPPVVNSRVRLHGVSFTSISGDIAGFKQEFGAAIASALGIASEQILIGSVAKKTVGSDGLSAVEIEIEVDIVPGDEDNFQTVNALASRLEELVRYTSSALYDDSDKYTSKIDPSSFLVTGLTRSDGPASGADIPDELFPFAVDLAAGMTMRWFLSSEPRPSLAQAQAATDGLVTKQVAQYLHARLLLDDEDRWSAVAFGPNRDMEGAWAVVVDPQGATSNIAVQEWDLLANAGPPQGLRRRSSLVTTARYLREQSSNSSVQADGNMQRRLYQPGASDGLVLDFSRRLQQENTGAYSLPYTLYDGDLYVLWSHAPSGKYDISASSYHGPTGRGSYTVNLYTGEAKPVSGWRPAKVAHAFFMFVSWGVLTPAAVIIARFFRYYEPENSSSSKTNRPQGRSQMSHAELVSMLGEAAAEEFKQEAKAAEKQLTASDQDDIAAKLMLEEAAEQAKLEETQAAERKVVAPLPGAPGAPPAAAAATRISAARLQGASGAVPGIPPPPPVPVKDAGVVGAKSSSGPSLDLGVDKSALKASSDVIPFWFRWHQVLNYASAVSQLLAFIIGVASVSRYSQFRTGHGILGLLVWLAAMAQPINALLRPKKPAAGEEAPLWRTVWEYWHKLGGYAVLVMAFLSMLLGAALISAQGGISPAPLVVVLLLVELGWFGAFGYFWYLEYSVSSEAAARLAKASAAKVGSGAVVHANGMQGGQPAGATHATAAALSMASPSSRRLNERAQGSGVANPLGVLASGSGSLASAMEMGRPATLAGGRPPTLAAGSRGGRGKQ